MYGENPSGERGWNKARFPISPTAERLIGGASRRSRYTGTLSSRTIRTRTETMQRYSVQCSTSASSSSSSSNSSSGNGREVSLENWKKGGNTCKGLTAETRRYFLRRISRPTSSTNYPTCRWNTLRRALELQAIRDTTAVEYELHGEQTYGIEAAQRGRDRGEGSGTGRRKDRSASIG